MQEEALTGLKVLDLSTQYAGPYAAKLLADSGADVLKVEPPAGDVSRGWGPYPGDLPHPEKSGTFLYLNTNKRGITLNLETATGRSLLRPLIEWADIIIESFPAGALERWGLGYAELEAINPAAVLTRVTPFGQTGPIANWEATEIVMQAMAGLMYISGAAEREPLKYPLMQGQFAAGANAAGVSLVAWFHRRMTGEGQQVDVSVIESMAGYYFSLLPTYTYTGAVSRRSRSGPGFQLFPAADGLIMTAQAPSGTWDDFAALLDAPELLDPKFATPAQRALHSEEYTAILVPKLLANTRRDWFDMAQAMRMPWGFVQTLDEIAADEHLAVRQFWAEMDHPAAGHLRLPGRPFKMSETPTVVRRPAPLLGEHNAEVFEGIVGLERADLAHLRTAGVV